LPLSFPLPLPAAERAPPSDLALAEPGASLNVRSGVRGLLLLGERVSRERRPEAVEDGPLALLVLARIPSVRVRINVELHTEATGPELGTLSDGWSAAPAAVLAGVSGCCPGGANQGCCCAVCVCAMSAGRDDGGVDAALLEASSVGKRRLPVKRRCTPPERVNLMAYKKKGKQTKKKETRQPEHAENNT
jgi:hypothetical protein